MTVGQLLKNLDSRELTEWIAFFQIENEERTVRDLQNEATMKARQARNG